jgi:3-phosphoshikimate 1-carboxyvinyltransferase
MPAKGKTLVPLPNYPATLPITPLEAAPDAPVPVPGSKSLTNRALILATLAAGRSTLRGALASEDTQVMIDALRRLGFAVDVDETGTNVTVEGQGGRLPAAEADLFLGNSGTSMRFLTALTALGAGCFRLDGTARMRERPQADLLTALQTLGVPAFSEQENGCPPLLVRGSGQLRGGRVVLRAEASSQFVTALLMVAPYAAEDVIIEIDGPLRPLYVEITRRMMAQWGVTVEAEGSVRFRVAAGQQYAPQPSYEIEPDASGASYFFAAAAVTGGRVTVPGLGPNSLQGDVRFATDVLAEMGCTVTHDANGLTVIGPPPGQLRGIDRDMSAISDTSLTLAAIAPFANSPTVVRNIAHTRLQECDRIAAACAELRRLGVHVEERADGFTVTPAARITPALIETYNDHRVAMSFALVGLKVPGIVLQNPACVAKTFPDFWQRLEKLRRPD